VPSPVRVKNLFNQVSPELQWVIRQEYYWKHRTLLDATDVTFTLRDLHLRGTLVVRVVRLSDKMLLNNKNDILIQLHGMHIHFPIDKLVLKAGSIKYFLKKLGIDDTATLTELSLHNVQIQSIEKETFSGLSSLKVISLNNAKINILPRGIFSGFLNLRQIYPRNTKIDTLTRGVFSNLQTLEQIYLYNTKIGVLQSGAFANCPNLNRVALYKDSEITTLARGAFSGLSRNFELIDAFSGLPRNVEIRVQLALLFNRLRNEYGDIVVASN